MHLNLRSFVNLTPGHIRGFLVLFKICQYLYIISYGKFSSFHWTVAYFCALSKTLHFNRNPPGLFWNISSFFSLKKSVCNGTKRVSTQKFSLPINRPSLFYLSLWTHRLINEDYALSLTAQTPSFQKFSFLCFPLLPPAVFLPYFLQGYQSFSLTLPHYKGDFVVGEG